jgi:thioredoxin 1
MDSIFTKIINSSRPVLIDFHKPENHYCQLLEPFLEQVKNCLEKRISIIKVDAGKNQQLATEYNIINFPTMLLFRKGKQLWRHSGVLNKAEIIGKIIEKYN